MNSQLLRGGLSYTTSLIKSKFKPVPLFANLFITRRCNLRCSFCSAIKRPARKELTLGEWKKCADVLYDLGNRYISITGGEPLVRDDLPEFVKYLSQKPRLHSVVTNGTMLTEKRLKKLAKAGLMHLGLSTQSLIPGKHVKSQNKDLIDLILKYKKKYRFEVSALVTITNDNVEEVPGIVNYLGQRGINVGPNLVTSGKGDWWFRSYCPELQFKKADLKKLKITINELSKSKNILYSKNYLKDLYNYARGQKPINCQAGSLYLSINDDGYVMPCQDFPPAGIHFTKLKEKYPLAKPKCNDCMWPCYYEENYKRDHLQDFLYRSAKLVLGV